jgi:HlyD family secretion protein
VLKVANAALRFRPQDANANSTSGSNVQASRQGRQAANAGGNAAGQPPQGAGAQSNNQTNFAPATAPVLAGQTRVVWVLGADGKPQARRIKVGLTDGVSTEVVEGNLQEGELAITSETLSASSKSTTTTQAAPGFGGAQRTPGGGAGRRN